MQGVYLGEFFLLEGYDGENMVVLGLAFDLNELIQFVKDNAANKLSGFLAFRVNPLGGVAGLLDSVAPTHSAPAANN